MDDSESLTPGAQGDPGQASMVYVYQTPKWEYKLLICNLEVENAPTQDEMTRLGEDGWELAGILSDLRLAHFYFKRLTRK